MELEEQRSTLEVSRIKRNASKDVLKNREMGKKPMVQP